MSARNCAECTKCAKNPFAGRVRKTASTGSAILNQLPSGKQVEIVDTATNGWYGIQLGSVKGYVSASYIKLLEEAAPVVTAEVSAVSASAAQSESTYVKVTADALNVRLQRR